uniref:Inner membrane protein n=1 Tax=Ascaris lumbricoides TaxID=6252 RepID=A0A0M3HJI9_ASCLU
MRYISAFHVFEFIIIFVGMIFLAFGIVTNSITLIATFIATLSITSISRILCIVFSFGFIAFDEKHCVKTFYASIHRDFGRSIGSDDRILAELCELNNIFLRGKKIP